MIYNILYYYYYSSIFFTTTIIILFIIIPSLYQQLATTFEVESNVSLVGREGKAVIWAHDNEASARTGTNMHRKVVKGSPEAGKHTGRHAE